MVFKSGNRQLRVFSYSYEQLFIDGQKPPSDFTYEKYLVQFIVPITNSQIDSIGRIDTLECAVSDLCGQVRDRDAKNKERERIALYLG
jgi:hypothetical protein